MSDIRDFYAIPIGGLWYHRSDIASFPFCFFSVKEPVEESSFFFSSEFEAHRFFRSPPHIVEMLPVEMIGNRPLVPITRVEEIYDEYENPEYKESDREREDESDKCLHRDRNESRQECRQYRKETVFSKRFLSDKYRLKCIEYPSCEESRCRKSEHPRHEDGSDRAALESSLSVLMCHGSCDTR